MGKKRTIELKFKKHCPLIGISGMCLAMEIECKEEPNNCKTLHRYVLDYAARMNGEQGVDYKRKLR